VVTSLSVTAGLSSYRSSTSNFLTSLKHPNHLCGLVPVGF
jgi:hypothetical protein